MTRRRLTLASVMVLAAGTAFSENTVPFPEFPDPLAACQKADANGEPVAKLLRNPRFEALVNVCVAKNQQGYDLARDAWPALTQKNATLCVSVASKIETFPYMMLGECAAEMLASQPLPPHTFNKW